MNRIAIDIETAPIPELLDRIPSPEVAVGNLKDPIKIQEKQAAALAAQREAAALDPHFASVVCIAVACRSSSREPLVDVQFAADFPRREASLLSWLWNTALSPGDTIATFNGSGFDLPFLLRRSLLLGVRSLCYPCGRYEVLSPRTSQHLDTCACLHYWEVGQGDRNPLGYRRDLAFYARTLLNAEPPHPEVDHAALGALVAAGHRDVVTAVCRWDVETTLRLTELLETVYP